MEPSAQEMQPKEQSKPNEIARKEPIFVWIFGLTAVIVWILNWILVDQFLCYEQGGQFGDRFGATTSLFGGITIILLLYTIHLQRQESKDAREEFKKQNRTLTYQKFDNTFFNLVELHKSNVNPVYLQTFEDEHINPLEAMKNLADLQSRYQGISLSYALKLFGSYIDHFKLVVEYVLEKKKPGTNRDLYLRIYFAQLSTREKIFLYYHLQLDATLWPIWDSIKKLLLVGVKSNHLHYPPHAKILDGISD